MITDFSQQLLDIVPQAILVINSDGQLLAVNGAARQLLPPELTVGSRFEDTNSPFTVLLDDLASQSDSFRREIRLSDTQVMEATITPFSPHGWAVTLYDISAHKEIEVQRNDLLNEVTHDLKQPISAILSFSDVLRASGELNAQQSQFLDRIRHAATRMSEQIHQLLDVSWIESGLSLAIAEVDLVSLAQTTLDELEPRALAKQIRLELDAPDAMPALQGDSNRLGQVLSNLVLNAVKYSPAESVVTVKLWTAGNQAIFSVTDQGMGISPENIPHLFDRFFRVRDRQTRNIEGTGLGLYIVQSIVEQHNGTVTVESEPGKGSTFTVYLPLNGSAVT